MIFKEARNEKLYSVVTKRTDFNSIKFTKNLQNANGMQKRKTNTHKSIIEFYFIYFNKIKFFVSFLRTLNQQHQRIENTAHEIPTRSFILALGRLNFVDRTRSNASRAADSLTRGYSLQVDADE